MQDNILLISYARKQIGLRLLFKQSIIFSGTIVAGSASYNREGSWPEELDFDRLVDLYYEPLYRFAMSLTRAENDAADLVQETFLTWARKGHQLQDPGKVKSWLFTTLHRTFLQAQRRPHPVALGEVTEAELEMPDVEPDLVSRLDGQEIVALLHQVDQPYQAAVALFYLEDYTYEEIGVILQVPLGTVKSRLARGLAQLKQLVWRAAQRVKPGKGGQP